MTLAGVSLLMLALTPEAQRAAARGDALATLGYVANWHRMTGSLDYWAMFSQPSPLDHTWSLAIEEQFYVLWPLVVLAVLVVARRTRTDALPRLAAVAGTGAAVSLLLLAVTYDPHDTSRAYFGTDTRIAATLLGAGLAVVCARRSRRLTAPSPPVRAAGALALGWILWSLVTVDGVHPWYYRGGLASVAAAALVVIYTVTGGPPGRLAAVLSWRPLCALGLVSYGVYLWHWPVIVFLTPDRAHLDGLPLDVVRIAVTLAVAALSYHLVEMPIRRGALSGKRIRLATPATFAATLGIILVATSGSAGTLAVPRGDMEGADSPVLYFPEGVADGTPRLLLVGDSGASVVGPRLVEEAERQGIAVAWSSEWYCSPVYTSDQSLMMPAGTTWDRPFCPERRIEVWNRLVEQYDPDIVVYYLASAGTAMKEQLDGQWVWDCDGAYDSYLGGEIAADVDRLAVHGATVVVAASPYIDIPEQTEPPTDDRVDCRNATYRRVAADRPGTELVDLNAWAEAERDRTGEEIMKDALHFKDAIARDAARWLLNELDGQL